MTRSLFSWLRGGSGRKPTRRLAGRRSFVPRVFALEDRTLPSCMLSLSPSEPAPQLVGDPVRWTATPSDCAGDLVYQFSVKAAGEPFHVVRDFSALDHFLWAPMEEGRYRIRVTAKDGYDGTDTVSAVVSDRVDSRVTGSHAVVTPTANPLVALFSVPPGRGGTVHVEFSVAGPQPDWRSTNELPRRPGKSTNFFVAGLLPETRYEMRYVVTDHHHEHHSSPLLFTTGAIPASVVFPPRNVLVPPSPGTDLHQDMLFQVRASAPQNAPYFYATDLAGRITWYYDAAQAGFLPSQLAAAASLVPGGTVLVTGADSMQPVPLSLNVLREIDLAGNPLRETNLAAVNAQLTALGHDIIYSFSHDVQRLPGGNTAVLGLTERTVDINGTPTNYIGIMVVVLDQDFQVTWAWDAFDHLDVNRGPVLGEVVQPGAGDPDAAVPNLPAVDWLHANTISWSPADQNLVVSLRQQDWTIKIDYANGAGDGHILWRLGQDGDFTVNSSDPSPWFSHQHDPHFIDDTTLIVFDNGNTRRASDPNANSRGQVWALDENSQTATLAFNVDLGNYSDRVGSAERLSNGNYCFTSGFIVTPPAGGQSIEVLPDGTPTYVLQLPGVALYRSFRVRTLYAGVSDQVDGGGGGSGGGSGASAVPPVAVANAFWAAIATAPAAAFAQPMTTTTPSATTSSVARAALLAERAPVDQLFAAGTGVDRWLALSHPRIEPLIWADDPWAAAVGTDGTWGDGAFPAVPKK
jgi:hypothetical protein